MDIIESLWNKITNLVDDKFKEKKNNENTDKIEKEEIHEMKLNEIESESENKNKLIDVNVIF